MMEGSPWARRVYDAEKMARSRERYPELAGAVDERAEAELVAREGAPTGR